MFFHIMHRRSGKGNAVLQWHSGCGGGSLPLHPRHSKTKFDTASSSSPTCSPSKRPPRVQEKLAIKIRRGADAKHYKQEHGDRLWLKEFVNEKWGCQPGSAGYNRLTQVVYKSIAANSLDAAEDLLQRPGQGRVATAHRSTVVSPVHRVRAGS